MRAIVAVVCIAALCAGAVNAVGVERIKHRAAALQAASEAEAESQAADVDQGVVIDSAFGLYTVSIAEQTLTPCKGTKGMCMDVNKYTCGGTGGKLVSGKCAGDKSILCCTGTPVEKPSSVAARVPTDPFPVTPVPPQPAVADRAVAFKATLTPAGIATLNKLVNSVLKKQLAKPIVIPDQALSMDKFALNVKNLVISSVAVGPVAIDVAPPATISASVSGGNAQADTDFAWTRTGLLRVSGSGHLTVTVADLAVKFGLSVTTTSSSKLQIQMTSSSVTIDKLNFKFSQSWDSFVLNAITGLFQSQLKPMIQTQISQGVVAPFNAQIKAILDGLPQSTTFGAGEMSCTLRIGFETVTAGTDGLTLGESLAVDCN